MESSESNSGPSWVGVVRARSGERLVVEIELRGDGEWALVHRCRSCAVTVTNRIAGDDDPYLLLSLAVRPLARPLFPLEGLAATLRLTPPP